MHELSIATAILDQLEGEARKRPGTRFTKVAVRVGELSGVDPDALSFSFEALVKDSSWEPLELEIQYLTRKQRCPSCRHEFGGSIFDTECPSCGELQTETVQGTELDIAWVEVEEVTA